MHIEDQDYLRVYFLFIHIKMIVGSFGKGGLQNIYTNYVALKLGKFEIFIYNVM